jgi:hypothetical protein
MGVHGAISSIFPSKIFNHIRNVASNFLGQVGKLGENRFQLFWGGEKKN